MADIMQLHLLLLYMYLIPKCVLVIGQNHITWHINKSC